VLSPEEVKRVLTMATSLKARAMLTLAYGLTRPRPEGDVQLGHLFNAAILHVAGARPLSCCFTGRYGRIPDLVRLSGIDLDVISQRSQKTHGPIELNLGES
jgi:hypothetical protein